MSRKARTLALSKPSIWLTSLSVVVFLTTTWLVVHRGLSGVELSLFNVIYKLPTWLRPVMLTITQAGSTWMVVVVACVFALQKRLRMSLQVVSLGIITLMSVELVKVLIARPRPFMILNNVVARERFVSGMGFPSGHAAVTTAVAMLVFQYIPKGWRWLVFVWVGLVSISRIYLGVHAPLDVVGGVALGLAVGQYFFLVWPEVTSKLVALSHRT